MSFGTPTQCFLLVPQSVSPTQIFFWIRLHRGFPTPTNISKLKSKIPQRQQQLPSIHHSTTKKKGSWRFVCPDASMFQRSLWIKHAKAQKKYKRLAVYQFVRTKTRSFEIFIFP